MPPHVRPAVAADADAMARLQRDAWRERFALLPAEAIPDEPTMADQWRAAVAAGVVLVAVENGTVAGFVASAPAADPDSGPGEVEIAEIAVAPAAAGRGHGSRLLAAWADVSSTAGATTGQMWVADTDHPLRDLLSAVGFAPDGAKRVLDLDGTGAITVGFSRLRTKLDNHTT